MGTLDAHENEFPYVLFAEGAAPSTPATGLVIAYAKADGLLYWKDDAGTEYAVGTGDTAGHLADTTDAHDASAISFTPAGTIAATDVQAAIEEVASEAGGTPSFVGCAAYRTTVQTVSANTETTMLYDAEEYDTSGIHEGVTNPGRMTIPTAMDGYWRFSAHVYSGGSPGTTGSYLYLRVDGTTAIVGSERDANHSTNTPSLFTTATVDLNAAQYVEVRHYGPGTSRGATTGALSLRFEAHYLGA